MRSLLVNPWIYDFAAFDLWNKPLGLLYLGSILKKHGWNVDLIDCLDRSDKLLRNNYNKRFKKYYTGHYLKERIDKPQLYTNIERHYSRYGLPLKIFKDKLLKFEKPDLILVTSGMTYWYPSVIFIVNYLREFYTDTPIILGGIYATLAPDHARKSINVDRVIEGECENRILDILSEVTGIDSKISEPDYGNIDNIPFPAFELYDDLNYLPLLTSRGCPLRCTFCASNKISGKFRRRSVDSVIDEITYFQNKYKCKNIAFYDDALLYEKEDHLLPILEGLLYKGFDLNFHTPNGIQANEIDQNAAGLMYRAGFKTIRVSLESTEESRKKDLSYKVTVEGFVSAVNHLTESGFQKNQIETYILMGLPGQGISEVINTMFFAAQLGVIIKLASFSPIPGTKDTERAIETGDLNPEYDLLETNNSVYINNTTLFSGNIAEKIKNLSRELNRCNREGISLPDKDRAAAEIRPEI